MKILFAFAFSKVRNKEEAEDLCSEIIVQVLNSIKIIKNEEAFYGQGSCQKCQRSNPKLSDECKLLASIALDEEVMQYTNSCINLIEDNIILNKDGDLKPNFPILTQDMLESLGNELNQIIEDINTSTLTIIE